MKNHKLFHAAAVAAFAITTLGATSASALAQESTGSSEGPGLTATPYVPTLVQSATGSTVTAGETATVRADLTCGGPNNPLQRGEIGCYYNFVTVDRTAKAGRNYTHRFLQIKVNRGDHRVVSFAVATTQPIGYTGQTQGTVQLGVEVDSGTLDSPNTTPRDYRSVDPQFRSRMQKIATITINPGTPTAYRPMPYPR